MIDFREVTKFLDKVFLELLRSGVDMSYNELDHICYRVETLLEYGENKEYLQGIGNILSETEIGGRLIHI